MISCHDFLTFDLNIHRDRDGTLRSSTLVTKTAYRLWLPALLVNLTLDSACLPEIFQLLSRDPTLGQNVRSLKFLQAIIFNQEIKQGLIEGLRRLEEGVFNAAKACSSIQHPIIQDLVIKHPSEGNEFSHRVSENLLDYVRIIILQSLPNLTTLKTEGQADWLLDLHLERPLSSHPLQNSKVFDACNAPPIRSERNGIWLLLFLPSLHRATLQISPDKKDRACFKSHVGMYSGKSQVKVTSGGGDHSRNLAVPSRISSKSLRIQSNWRLTSSTGLALAGNGGFNQRFPFGSY